MDDQSESDMTCPAEPEKLYWSISLGVVVAPAIVWPHEMAVAQHFDGNNDNPKTTKSQSNQNSRRDDCGISIVLGSVMETNWLGVFILGGWLTGSIDARDHSCGLSGKTGARAHSAIAVFALSRLQTGTPSHSPTGLTCGSKLRGNSGRRLEKGDRSWTYADIKNLSEPPVADDGKAEGMLSAKFTKITTTIKPRPVFKLFAF